MVVVVVVVLPSWACVSDALHDAPPVPLHDVAPSAPVVVVVVVVLSCEWVSDAAHEAPPVPLHDAVPSPPAVVVVDVVDVVSSLPPPQAVSPSNAEAAMASDCFLLVFMGSPLFELVMPRCAARG